jgi:hypothetical protein
MTARTRTLLCAALLLTALAFRLALASGWPNDEPDDARFYTLLARNVLTQGVYSGASEPPFTPTYVRVPGYPLFIAGVYRVFGVNNDTAVRLVQAVIETATCWSIACLAIALAPATWLPARRRRVHLAALAIATVCPFTAIYVTTVLTEVWAMALGTLIAWFATRAIREAGDASDEPANVAARWRAARWWFAAGVAGGALTIVRPEGGLLMAGAGATCVLIGAWRWMRRRLSFRGWVRQVAWWGVPLFAGFLVCDGPWIVRNALVFGRFQPAAPGTVSMPGDFVTHGYAQWLKTWVNEPKWVAPFEFDQDRARFDVNQLPPWAFDSPEERRIVTELFAIYNDGPPGHPVPGRAPNEPVGVTPALDAQFKALGAQRMARHPIRFYLLLPAERLFWMWATPHAQYYPWDGDLLPWAELDRDRNQQIWLPVFMGFTLCWTVFGLMGIARVVRDPASRAGLLLLLLIAGPRLVLLASIENPEPRYLVELFPFLSALGGVAIGSIGLRSDQAEAIPTVRPSEA